MTTKTKVLSLKELIKKGKFNYVDSDITIENFPEQEIRSSDYKLYNFARSISSEDAIKEMEKDGFAPANIFELLSWSGWNGKDYVVGLGSSFVLDGYRSVPYLGGWSGRGLDLDWWDGEWCDDYRFLAVRTSSLVSQPLVPQILSSSDTLQKSIEEVKKAGYKVIKEM